MSQPSPTAGIVEAKGQLVVELTRLRRENEELRALFPAAQAIGRPIFFGDRSEKQARAQLGEHVSRSGHWEEDAQHKTVRWSAGIYHLLGCRVGACEPSFDQLCARIHESSREDVLQAILRANELASEASVICKLVGFDGVVREVDLRYEVIDGHSASARRAIGTLHDRHELRRAQEELLHIRAEYREAQRLAGVGSFFLDVRRKRYRWSRELFRILGIDDDLEPTTRLFGERVHPADRSRVRKLLEAALAGQETRECEFAVVTPNGEARTVQLRLCARHSASGDVVSVIGTVLDLTRRKVLEDRLMQAQKLEAMGQFASGIAHDFNNVLTAILANAELAVGQYDGEEIMEIMRAAEHASGLTRDLLAFCRQAPLSSAVINLRASLQKIFGLVRRVVGDGVQVNFNVASDLWEVRGSHHQFLQIFLNLAINAKDAMQGSGSLQIVVENAAGSESSLQWVKMSIQDSGCGIDAEEIRYIFEPFYTTKPPGQGTGLGLASVYGIVYQHGGHIEVRSELGLGTTFVVYWPRVGDALVPAADTSLALGTFDRAGRRNHTIFLVLAALDRRVNFVGPLVDGGYRVLQCSYLHQAAQWMHSGLLCDLMVVSASEVAQQDAWAEMDELRQHGIEVLLLDADQDLSLRKSASNSGLHRMPSAASVEELLAAISQRTSALTR